MVKEKGDREVVGVILFKAVGERNVRYFKGSLANFNEILMKITLLVLGFSVFKTFEDKTRI